MDKSLSSKLYLSILTFVLLVFFTSVYSLFICGKQQAGVQSSESDHTDYTKLNSTNQIQLALAHLQSILVQAKYATTPEQAQEGMTAVQEFKSKIDELTKKGGYISSEGKSKAFFDEFSQKWKEFDESNDKFFTLLKENKSSDAQTLYKDILGPKVLKMQSLFDSLQAADFSELTAPAEDTNETNSGSKSSLRYIFVFVILLICAAITYFTVRVIKNTSAKILDSSDNLKKLGVASGQIGSSLQSSSESLSSAVSKQASSLHDTSAAIDEITSMINRTSENAKESLQVAKESSKKAEEGEKIMERMVAAMETIQESSAQLQNIANIITQINSKTAVINEIVSKTELLSLNASIESARAGEHGKGFAVVAEEVGNLAKVSGKSANEIQALIQSSQEQVNQIIHSTKLRVEDGKKVTNEAQETFQKISENISNMSSVIEQITQATKEQEIGIRQISTSILDMDKVTKENQVTVCSNLENAKKLVEQSKRIDKTSKEIEREIKGVK